MKQRLSTLSLMATAALTASNAVAGTLVAPPSPGKNPVADSKPLDPCEKFWAWATLHKDDSNPFLQEFALIGRYQAQYALADRSGAGDGDADNLDNRRVRMGFRAKALKDFEVKMEAFADPNAGDIYAGLAEAYVAWKPDDAFNLTVGKHKPRFSLDWTTSSREIVTIERNIMINNLGLDFATGASVSGKQGKLSYFAGSFNNETLAADGMDEWGDLDGGWSYTGSLAYDVSAFTGTEKASARIDYLHSEGDGDQLIRHDDALAVSLALKQGAWGLNSELLYAERSAPVAGGDGDMWGFYLMPTYDFSKRLQLVMRYTHAESDGAGIQAQSRYERLGGSLGGGPVGPTVGDSYDALYLGLNYYICGHKLKLMSGVEWAELGAAAGGVETWTLVSGVRLFF